MSSYSGDAADQAVRMTLEGAEVAVRLAGSGAKHLAVFLYAVLRDQKKTKGKIRLTNLLRSGKELKVFAVRDQDLPRFCQEAKRYGVLYTVLKDNDAKDGLTDIMVRAEDASKINRIFERFRLATVDIGSVKAQIEQEREDRLTDPEVPGTEEPPKEEDTADAFINRLMHPEQAEGGSQDPKADPAGKSPQSGPFSDRRSRTAWDGSDPGNARPSVRKELAQIRREQKEAAKTKELQIPLQHMKPKEKVK